MRIRGGYVGQVQSSKEESTTNRKYGKKNVYKQSMIPILMLRLAAVLQAKTSARNESKFARHIGTMMECQ